MNAPFPKTLILALLAGAIFGLAGCGTPGEGDTLKASAPQEPLSFRQMSVSVYYLVAADANRGQKNAAEGMASGEFALMGGVRYRMDGGASDWDAARTVKVAGFRSVSARSPEGSRWQVMKAEGTVMVPVLPAASQSFTVELGLDEIPGGAEQAWIMLTPRFLAKARRMIPGGKGSLYLKTMEWNASGEYFSATFAICPD